MVGLVRDPQTKRVVVFLGSPGADPQGHEGVTHRSVARQIASLKQWDYGGDYDPIRHARQFLYFVPGATLDAGLADRLHIRGERDLFGGVVPAAFAATKTITHPLVEPAMQAPRGWCSAFGDAVRTVTLPGYSAFTADQALAAGRRILERGAVRLKQASGVAGLGQTVVHDLAELEERVAQLDASGELDQGLVLEPNLVEIDTYSVGRVRIDDMVVTYYGRQRLTANHRGQQVYGGSDLVVVRGDFEDLLAQPLSETLVNVLRCAHRYHAAALRSFPGLFASRCNYDVAQGCDEAGTHYCGVLEQSWRVGGASGAELAAIGAFLRDPHLRRVRASTTEVYGERPSVPPDAHVYFAGNDPRVGPLTKYARLENNGADDA